MDRSRYNFQAFYPYFRCQFPSQLNCEAKLFYSWTGISIGLRMFLGLISVKSIFMNVCEFGGSLAC